MRNAESVSFFIPHSPFCILHLFISDSYRIRNHRLCDRGHHNRFHSRRIRNHIRLPVLIMLQFLLLSVRERR